MNQDNWLIVGGAGYIGSHFVSKLIAKGIRPIVIDNFSTGKWDRVHIESDFFEIDCNDYPSVHQLLLDYEIKNVVHLAARRQARESMNKPSEYWIENTGATLNLIQAITGTLVEHVIYSSSCSVYGDSGKVTPQSPSHPTSVYGKTKLNSEQILMDCAEELGFKLAILRYFNVVGASGQFNGFDRTPGAIIPAFTEKLLNSEEIQIFGSSFPTPDGTAVRDYVDVRDLVDAHILAHEQMKITNKNFESLICSGKPISVLEIANLIGKILKITPQIVMREAAPGDPAEVWADPDIRLTNLGWKRNYEIEQSIKAHLDAVKKFSISKFDRGQK